MNKFSNIKSLILAALVSAGCVITPSTAHAGPMDWIARHLPQLPLKLEVPPQTRFQLAFTGIGAFITAYSICAAFDECYPKKTKKSRTNKKSHAEQTAKNLFARFTPRLIANLGLIAVGSLTLLFSDQLGTLLDRVSPVTTK